MQKTKKSHQHSSIILVVYHIPHIVYLYMLHEVAKLQVALYVVAYASHVLGKTVS